MSRTNVHPCVPAIAPSCHTSFLFLIIGGVDQVMDKFHSPGSLISGVGMMRTVRAHVGSLKLPELGPELMKGPGAPRLDGTATGYLFLLPYT